MPESNGQNGGSGWGWAEGFRQRVRDVLVTLNKNLEPASQQLKTAERESRRVANAVETPVKAAIRNTLRGANAALDPIAQPLKAAETASRHEADKFERFAKESGLEDTANAVQIAEGGVGLWKGGAKLAQVLKNPETRQAFLNLVKQPQDAWDVAKQMNARRSEFRAEQSAVQEAKQLHAMSEQAGQYNAMKDVNHLLKGVNPDRGLQNCQSAVVASYHRFYGMGDVVIPAHEAPSVAYLEGLFNRQFHDVKGAQEVVDSLKASGHGSSGVLWYWDASRQTNHVVFAANSGGHVVFMDGQLEMARMAHEFDGMAGYRFLPTPRVPGVEPVLPYHRPISETLPQAHVPPPAGGTPFGMRPQDQEVFQDAARVNNRWILVRHTNPESLPYVGQEGYVPKRIDCKAKTADVAGHPHAGLVVDPNTHPEAYRDVAAAQRNWHVPEGYAVDSNPQSSRYGCLQREGKYIHGDYDIYDIVDPNRRRGNLALVTELHGEQHFQGAGTSRVGNYVNERIGAPMVQHGGEAQFKDHSNQRVMAFGPLGQRFELNGEQAVRDLYSQRFDGRMALDRSKPFDPRSAGLGPIEPAPAPGGMREPETKKPAGAMATLSLSEKQNDLISLGGAEGYATSERLKKGYIGEELAAYSLQEQGHKVLYYKPDIRGTNQGGIDIVTMKDGKLYVIDNKAYASGKDVGSVSALDSNLKQNAKEMRKEFLQYANDKARSPEERETFRDAAKALKTGDYQRAVTTAAVAEDGKHAADIREKLRGKGFEYLDLYANQKPRADVSADLAKLEEAKRRIMDEEKKAPPSPGGSSEQGSADRRQADTSKPQPRTAADDAGQKADLETARRVADGRDVETGRRPAFFRGPVSGPDEETRRQNAAQFAERKQKDASDQQERLARIASEQRAREEAAAKKMEQDLKNADRGPDHKKEAQQEHKVEQTNEKKAAGEKKDEQRKTDEHKTEDSKGAGSQASDKSATGKEQDKQRQTSPPEPTTPPGGSAPPPRQTNGGVPESTSTAPPARQPSNAEPNQGPPSRSAPPAPNSDPPSQAPPAHFK